MPTLRELIEADATKRFRVKIGKTEDGRDLFRDNQPGDRLPEGGATYGLPPEERV